MSLDPAEIDKERGVVIEEWRGGLGASSRLRDQQIPVLYYKSKYAERLPIGKPEVLRSFTPDRLRAFYTKWYRPDRMALVVVGDIDPRADGGDDPRRVRRAGEAGDAGARSRLRRAAASRSCSIKVATDPEAQQSSVSLVRKKPQAAAGPRRATTAATWCTGSSSR